MGLKSGFRQTELGMFPDDWDVSPLGECLLSRPRYGINAAAVPYSDLLPMYIRITDITPDGKFAPAKRVSVDASNSDSYFLADGDIVFARTGASVGKSYYYRNDDGPLVFAGFLIRVRTDEQRLLPAYLAAYVTTDAYWSWVRLMSMRSGQPGINANEYALLPVPRPKMNEQRAIAMALSDADALLGVLDRLINKKHNLKQALMQQLLTGRTRLPGFSEKWETTTLGKLGSLSKGKGIRKDSVLAEGLPCIRYGEIYTHHNDVIRSFHSFISRKTAEESRRLKTGDLVFACSGETAEEIGKCVAFIGHEEAYVGGDTVIWSPSGHDSQFLGYLMNHSSVAARKARMAQGDAVVHISARNLAALTISIPEFAEQHAIGLVLSDADAEITALKQRRDKTRSVKQGMVQELLTGRTRLV